MAVFSTLKTPLSWSLSSGNSLRSLSTPKARARPLQSTCHWLKQKRFRARRLGGQRGCLRAGPEVFIEAFANIYREAARAIHAEVNGGPPPEDLDFPTVNDGMEGDPA